MLLWTHLRESEITDLEEGSSPIVAISVQQQVLQLQVSAGDALQCQPDLSLGHIQAVQSDSENRELGIAQAGAKNSSPQQIQPISDALEVWNRALPTLL